MIDPMRWSRRAHGQVALAGFLILAAHAAASDFYYYRGHPVVLERDPSYAAVELAAGASVAAVQTLALPDGTAARGEVVFDQSSRGRYVLHLTNGAAAPTSPGLAVRALTLHPQVRRTYPVYRNPKTGLRVYIFDEITVRVQPDVGAGDLVRFGAARDVSIVERNAFEPDIYLLRVAPAGGSALDAANEYAKSGLCQWAEPNFGGQIFKYAVNDPLYPLQWHLNNTGQTGGKNDADVDAPEAWAISSGSPGIVIALLDDGCDLNHEDLRDNIFTNPGEIPGNGIDDDHNGYVDDVHGWDFYDNDNDPNHSYPTGQTEGHGTATAGIAAAVGNNGIGVAGIAYRCKIMEVKVFRGSDFAGEFHVANAIRYASRLADVLSNSWGGGAFSQDLESAFQYALRNGRHGLGTPIVFAAGNSGLTTEVEYPASSPWTIAVGASDYNDVRYSYSSYGPHLTVLAPSGNFTTDRTGLGVGYDGGYPDTTGNYTGMFSGTSSACPLGAGTAALILSLNPNLTAFQVQAILQKTTTKVNPAKAKYDSHGFSLEYGYGRVNAWKALQLVQQGGLAEDTFEPNNTRAASKLIEKGFYSALCSNDDDWYATDVQPFQDIDIQLYFMRAKGNLAIELYNPFGQLAATSVGTTDTEQIERNTGAGGGRWCIRVVHKSAGTNYYHMLIDKRPPDDRFEPNDTLEQAADLAPGDYDLRGYDPDYFRVHVRSGQKLTALIRFWNELGDLDLYLLNAGGGHLADSATLQDVEGLSYVNAGPDADLILFVDNYNNSQNTYRLHLEVGPGADDRFEPNNTRAQAAPVRPGAYAHLQPYDNDWYKIAVGPRQFLETEIRFFNAVGDLDLELYDAAGRMITSSRGNCDFERVIFLNTNLTTTTVYPLVYLVNGTPPDYTLALTLRNLSDDRFEPNNDLAHAPTLTPAVQEGLMAMNNDFYGLDARQGKTVAAVIADEPSLPRVSATVYTPTGIPLASTLTGQPPVVAAAWVPTTGTFRVGVFPSPGALANPYALGLFVYDSTTTPSASEDPYEPNDTRRTARLVPPGARVNLFCANDDWFKVRLEEGESLQAAITFDGAEADLDLALYDYDGQLVDISAGTGNSELCLLRKAPLTEYYYVRVFPSRGSTNYNLLIGRGVPIFKLAAKHWELY